MNIEEIDPKHLVHHISKLNPDKSILVVSENEQELEDLNEYLHKDGLKTEMLTDLPLTNNQTTNKVYIMRDTKNQPITDDNGKFINYHKY